LKKLDEIVSSRYEPNNVDILLARLRTTAVSETTFEHAGVNFNIIDVGGQKGERFAFFFLTSNSAARTHRRTRHHRAHRAHLMMH
jgi:hypothetical protein